jgi:hypothetical protein
VSIAPRSRNATRRVASKWPDVMEKGEGLIVVTGSGRAAPGRRRRPRRAAAAHGVRAEGEVAERHDHHRVDEAHALAGGRQRPVRVGRPSNARERPPDRRRLQRASAQARRPPAPASAVGRSSRCVNVRAAQGAGISYKAHAKEIDNVIQKTSQLSGLDDEDLQDAFTNIVRVTGDVNKSLKLTGLAADFARAKHIEVAKAGEIVGKVAGGNTGILSRYGIQIDKGATATEALGALQQKFAGQAEAYGKTTRARVRSRTSARRSARSSRRCWPRARSRS